MSAATKDTLFQKFNLDGYDLLNNVPIEMKMVFSTSHIITKRIVLFIENVSGYLFPRFCFEHTLKSKRLL